MKSSSPQKPDHFRSLVGIAGALLSLVVCTPKAKPTSLIGAWSITCEDPDVLEVTTSFTAILTTNQNQIIVETAVLGSAPNYELRFSRPGEMGAGGDAVDWKTISTSAPIAVIHLESDTSASMTWKGFLDTQKNSRIWVSEAEFWNGGKNIHLKKCP